MPSSDLCAWGVCLSPLVVEGERLFGFAEYLAALALMVLAWTTADVRYRFRIRIAPLPLRGITFAVVASVGLLTLLTDVWVADRLLVPRGDLITTAQWRAVLGLLFLITFLLWAWFAFIQPPTFRPANAKRFAQALYASILKGDQNELAVIADELASSMPSLVRHAPTRRGNEEPLSEAAQYAHDILLLIADRRFCRAIVARSPGTALSLFVEMAELEKYDIGIETFGQNLVAEALDNRDSFLFHETEGYQTGFMGYLKPLSSAIFANYRLVEDVGSLLDPWWDTKWDASQWRAYCRITLLTFKSYMDAGRGQHSYVLHRAIHHISRSADDLYTLDGIDNARWDSDPMQRLSASLEFIKDAVVQMDGFLPPRIYLRIRERASWRRSMADLLADAALELMCVAATVKSPKSLAWTVQHNKTWRTFFNFGSLSGPAGKVFKFKLRRLIFDRIKVLERFGDYQAAYLLGLCLNVMGLELLKFKNLDHDMDSRALHQALLNWTRKNYASLHLRDPYVAQACLLEGLSFDEANNRLCRESGLGRRFEKTVTSLKLDPPAPPLSNRNS